MDVAVSNQVIARDEFGRFIAEIELAGANMMRQMAEDGAQLSREFAPKGGKPDKRTATISESITPSWTATSASWTCTARHALPQEFGGRPHEISGDVTFFWEKMGRMWHPGQNIISHPGNPSRPYLRPAYEVIMARWDTYAKRYYPNR